MAAQKKNVFAPVSQRRQFEFETVQAEKKVRSEFTELD
jgi:hypothetical protein